MKNIKITGLTKSLKKHLQPVIKHITIIVFAIIGGFLIFAVYSVSQILNQPTDLIYLEEQQKSSVRSRFDDTTIHKIKELKNREESNSLALPTDKRVNPFRE